MKINESLFNNVDSEEIEDIEDVYSNNIDSYPMILSMLIHNEWNAQKMSIGDFCSKVISKLANTLDEVLDDDSSILDRSPLFFMNDWCYSDSKYEKLASVKPQMMNGYCAYDFGNKDGNFTISWFIYPAFLRYFQIRRFFKNLIEPAEKLIQDIDNTLSIFTVQILDLTHNKRGFVLEDYFHEKYSIFHDTKGIAMAYAMLLPKYNANSLIHTILTEKANTIIKERKHVEDIIKNNELPAQFNKRKIKLIEISGPNGEGAMLNMIKQSGELISKIWANSIITYDYVVELCLFGSGIYNNKFETLNNQPVRLNMVNICGELVFEKWIDRIKDIESEYGKLFIVEKNRERNFLNQYGVIIGEEWKSTLGGEWHKLSYNDGYTYYIDPIERINAKIYREYPDGKLELAPEIAKALNEIKPEKKKKPSRRK